MIYSAVVSALLILSVASIQVRDACHNVTDQCLEYKRFSHGDLFGASLKTRVENLNAWIRHNKLNLSEFEVRVHQGKPHLYALKNIEKGDRLMAMGGSQLFKRDSFGVKSFQNPTADQIEHFYEYPPIKFQDEADGLAFALLYHLHFIKGSNFKEYILALPHEETYGFLQLMTDFSEILKEDPEMYESIVDRRRNLRNNYLAARQAFETALDHEQRSSIIGKEELSMSDYVWARYIVDSRAWTDKDKKFIVPGADFVKQEPYEGGSSMEHGIKRGYPIDQTLFHMGDSSSVVFKAERATLAKHEIVESIGEFTNMELLLLQGYVPEDNREDCVSVDIFSKEKFAEIHQVVRKFAFNLGLTFRGCLSNEDTYFYNIAGLNTLLNVETEIAQEWYARAMEIAYFSNKNVMPRYLYEHEPNIWNDTLVPNITRDLKKRIESFTTLQEKINKYALENEDTISKPFMKSLNTYYKEKIKLSRGIIQNLENLTPSFLQRFRPDEDIMALKPNVEEIEVQA